jgi:DNA (cytosine-5)-methyltransferase 1
MVNQQSLNELALFAGAGGGILGGQLLGWRTVCAVEWEPYPASVLCARQNEGLLPHFPIWDDVQTFDGKPWRGIVDVISGGFPCQDISCAGKGAGIEGTRSGMWKEFARIISEVQPQYVFVENSPMLTSRGLGTVLGDLASMGFDAEWGVLSAADVGANHQRERIWILAYSSNGEHTDSVRGVNAEAIRVPQENWTERSGCGMSSGTSGMVGNGGASRVCDERSVAYSNSTQFKGNERSVRSEQKHSDFGSSSWWETEPDVGRVADGVAARVDRLKAIGNGQVPLCAATAFKLLRERLK